MNEPREPLHQPPNPDHLRRVPPTSPDCAQVRGWLRDFADQDLEPEHTVELEEHVHRCRVCAVELARAEHETLRLRSAFRSLAGSPGVDAGVLPEGFAARVVERLVLDETSLVSKERLRQAAAAAAAMQTFETKAPVRRLRVQPLTLLAAALLLLVGLGFGRELVEAFSDAPTGVARLVVVDARDAFEFDRRLVAGDGLGANQSMRVGSGGGARVDWHDPSAKTQPAATLLMQGKGEMRLEAGQPLLVDGVVEITAHRAVSIPMADGSNINLGVGRYEIAVAVSDDLSADPGQWSGNDPIAWMPRDLQISIEVKDGAAATIERSTAGQTLVSKGEIGVYRGSGDVTVTSVVGPIAADKPASREPVPTPVALPTPKLFGHLRDRSGAAVAGAEVLLAFGAAGTSQHRVGQSIYDGSFTIESPASVDSGYVVAMGLAVAQPHLAVIAPEAHPVVRLGIHAQFQAPLVFEASQPVLGFLNDDAGNPVAGAQVLPCVVDEWFGTVLPLGGQRTVSAANGAFRVERLPARLPVHQALLLLVLRDGFDSVAVQVPVRSVATASQPPLMVTMHGLHHVLLHMLPGDTGIEVLEELPGCAPGSGYWPRPTSTDSEGRAMVLVGSQRLWVRIEEAAVVRELVLDELSPNMRYRPATGPALPIGSVFRETLGVAGVKAQLVSSWRHQRFVPPLAMDNPRLLRVGGEFGAAVAHAQVFGVLDTGPRNAANVRFFGLTSNAGLLTLPDLLPGEDVLVLGVDGASAFVNDESLSSPLVPVTLTAPGRVLVSESVRNAVGSDWLALRFQRSSDSLPGLAPEAIRFASQASSFEVAGLPAGDYRVTIGSSVFSVSVAPGGFVVLE